MAQQIFDKGWPLGKNGASELVPGGAILQTRDGKDEPITLAGAMQYDSAADKFLPTDKDNPLEVRVRQLETLIGSVLAKMSDDPSTATAQQEIKALLDSIDDKAATESTLGDAVAKLTALVNRLDQTLQVQFAEPQEVTLTGQTEVVSLRTTEVIAAVDYSTATTLHRYWGTNGPDTNLSSRVGWSVGAYESVDVLFINSSDKMVNTRILAGWDPNSGTPNNFWTIADERLAAGARKLWTSVDFVDPRLGRLPYLWFYTKWDEAITTGSIKILIIGRS